MGLSSELGFDIMITSVHKFIEIKAKAK